MIVILSFNHPELTTRTLESVQQVSPSRPVLLVHNGSESRFVTKHREAWPGIEHLILEKNRGYTGGVNAGLKKAFEKADWVLLLTNDCRLIDINLPGPEEEPALKAPQIFARKLDRIDSYGGAFSPVTGKLSHLKSPQDLSQLQNSVDRRTLPYVPGTAFWIHREVFESIGGFDERLGTYWEDVDFSVRAWQRGFALQVDLQTKIIHGIGKTCHKDPYYTTFLYQRNRRLISKKYAREHQLTTPLHIRLHGQLAWDYSRLLTRSLRRRDWQRLSLLWKSLR
jgi:GT2 family glycosyltransferase